MQKKQYKCKDNDNRIRIYHEGLAIEELMFADSLTESWLVISIDDLSNALKKVGYELTLIPE